MLFGDEMPLTVCNSDRAEMIQRRHEFFSRKMYEALAPKLKDPVRVYGALEREIIYYRDKRRCQFGDHEVAWGDAEIHHVEEHAKGGATQTSAFAAKWRTQLRDVVNSSV